MAEAGEINPIIVMTQLILPVLLLFENSSARSSRGSLMVCLVTNIMASTWINMGVFSSGFHVVFGMFEMAADWFQNHE